MTKAGELPTIVVLEDDGALRRIIEISLGKIARWKVHAAATVADGLALGASINPDLYLVDLMLPDGDGLTVIEIMRRGALAVRPVIVLSAVAQSESRRAELLARGATGVLGKPFDPPTLAATLLAIVRTAGVPK
jgi:DNA-binding response OmpR family regulator